MEEVRYMISEAAKRVDVESHVLRYWQKELALPISRNEMDQRYYKESDIELFTKVKHLKEQGFQLKAIKMLLLNMKVSDSLDSDMEIQIMESQKTESQKTEGQEDKVMEIFHEDKLTENEGTSLITEEVHEIKEESNNKMDQFKAIMNHIIISALKENNDVLSEEISLNVTDGVVREMNYLMRLQEEKEEERFKKFDATLRDYQKSKSMAAATIDKNRKKSKFFLKHKVSI
ncbi:MAG: helix-turn-helix domain-containing protein [Herbinix sp.]|nr:helix-turn-helix domain-containing protein [Herbinix sp.]